MSVGGFTVVTIRACGATFVLLVNGVRTLRWCAVGDCAHRLTADAALTILTGGGFKRPHGVIGAQNISICKVVTSHFWRKLFSPQNYGITYPNQLKKIFRDKKGSMQLIEIIFVYKKL